MGNNPILVKDDKHVYFYEKMENLTKLYCRIFIIKNERMIKNGN